MQVIPNEVKEQLTRRVVKLMGNRFEITVSGSLGKLDSCIDLAIEEISRIERLLTTFSEESQTAMINRYAGIHPVEVDPEVFHLIARAIKISELTQGAFDITYGSIDKRLWNFDTTMKTLPDPQVAKASVRLINYKNIILDVKQQTVFLKEKGMRIGFGGIGKGYAADRAKAVLQQCDVQSGVVNASGDLITWGTQPDGQPWTVGIADPQNKQKAFSALNISNAAIATSGNYEKYIVIDGKRYAHTIDPRTGFPVHGIKSVTIICPIAELADAMATPVMVMGVRPGLEMINQIKGMACIIIDDQDRLYTTKNIQLK